MEILELLRLKSAPFVELLMSAVGLLTVLGWLTGGTPSSAIGRILEISGLETSDATEVTASIHAWMVNPVRSGVVVALLLVLSATVLYSITSLCYVTQRIMYKGQHAQSSAGPQAVDAYFDSSDEWIKASIVRAVSATWLATAVGSELGEFGIPFAVIFVAVFLILLIVTLSWGVGRMNLRYEHKSTSAVKALEGGVLFALLALGNLLIPALIATLFRLPAYLISVLLTTGKEPPPPRDSSWLAGAPGPRPRPDANAKS